jgi:hypothetical protein
MKGKSTVFSMPKDKIYQHSRQHLKVNISSECLQASYAISLRAAKCKTPHTVVQHLVVPISSSHGGEYDVQSCLLGYTAV